MESGCEFKQLIPYHYSLGHKSIIVIGGREVAAATLLSTDSVN